MGSAVTPGRWRTLIAYGIIYFVWGSTFFAIRVGVHEAPPLLFAAVRFFVAGLVLCAWAFARSGRFPSGRQWLSILLTAFLIFVLDYGLLFSAERRVPSGVAAVILATIPGFMALFEIALLRTERLTLRLGVVLLIGLAGVAVLVDPSVGVHGPAVYWPGAVGLLIAAVSWSAASILSRILPMPDSKLITAGTQMLAGGVMLNIAALAFGELGHVDLGAISAAGWVALSYLIVAGSLIGFTAYTWLLHHESPTKVGTYAYVNPIVAVVIGYFLGGEALDLRTATGIVLILVSVVVITARRPVTSAARREQKVCA